jgi:hypothetical protein
MKNLHAIVRKSITGVHPDEECTLYMSAGQINDKGNIYPKYYPGIEVKAQIQTMREDTLTASEFGVGVTESLRRFYLYSDPPGADVSVLGVYRPLLKGGDIIKRADGTYWLVTSIVRDFTKVGWICVLAVLQVDAPDFTHSDWYSV